MHRRPGALALANSVRVGRRARLAGGGPAPTPPPVADFQWRADQGLTAAHWLAAQGGVDLTITGAPAVSPVDGITFTGANGIQVSGTPPTMDIGWVFFRLNNVVDRFPSYLLVGGNEIFFNSSAVARFALSSDASSNVIWETKNTNLTSAAFNAASYLCIAFAGVPRTTLYVDGDLVGLPANLPLEAGVYDGKFSYHTGADNFQVGGAFGGSSMQMKLKELQVFKAARALSADDIAAVRADLMARWP